MTEQNNQQTAQDNQQEIKDGAHVGKAVARDVQGDLQHQEQSGGVNVGQSNTIDAIGKIIGRDYIDRFIHITGQSSEEIARLIKSPEEIQQRWRQLVVELLDTQLQVSEQVLTCMHATVWPDERPIEIYQNVSELFHKIIGTRFEQRPSDVERIFIFIHALAKELPDADMNSLISWLNRASYSLQISIDTLNNWSKPTLIRYKALCSESSSLLVAIKPSRAQSRFHVRVSLERPHIGRRVLHAEDTVLYTLPEIQALLSNLRQKKNLPRWTQGTLTIEFLLPIDLLSRLYDDWQIDAWPCDEYNQLLRKSISKKLGTLNPIVIRSAERQALNDFLESKELWTTKWNYVSKWFADPHQPPPRIVCMHEGHTYYVSPDIWSDHEDIVGIVMVDPIGSGTSSDYVECLANMLLSGLPIGIWLTPNIAIETGREYMQQFFSSATLRELPKKVWEERKKAIDSASPGANLVLFWDDWERTPADNIFWSPDEEEYYG